MRFTGHMTTIFLKHKKNILFVRRVNSTESILIEEIASSRCARARERQYRKQSPRDLR